MGGFATGHKERGGTLLPFSYSPELTGKLSRPWVKIPLSSLKGTAGAVCAQLVHVPRSNNFTNQTALLTVAKNAHVVGQQAVGLDAGPLSQARGRRPAAVSR